MKAAPAFAEPRLIVSAMPSTGPMPARRRSGSSLFMSLSARPLRRTTIPTASPASMSKVSRSSPLSRPLQSTRYLQSRRTERYSPAASSAALPSIIFSLASPAWSTRIMRRHGPQASTVSRSDSPSALGL